MEAPGSNRNHVIDAARASAVFVVVVFHSLLYVVRATDGGPELVPWAPPHWPWWLLSWLFMVIPVFFIAGGFAHALLVARMRADGTSYGHFLANRGRRLVGPLVFFVTVLAALSTGYAWLVAPEPAIMLTTQLMQLLWFIAVYLVVVALAPAAVAAHERWGWRPWAVVVALGAVVDAASFATGLFWLRNINLLLVWPAVHQLGIAYHQGWFRSRRRAVLSVVVGALVIVVLVFGCGYPGSSVGLADIPIANVQPPTSAMVALGLAQGGVLSLVDASGVLRRPPRWLTRAMGVVNALMMSVYLWHIGCIALAAVVLVAVSRVVPDASGVLLAQPTVAALTLVLVALIVPQLARLELRLIPPLGAVQTTASSVVAFVVLTLGTALVWQAGTVLHPAAPASTLGVLTLWAGYALMRRAASG